MLFTGCFLGSGTIHDIFHTSGTAHCLRDIIKIVQKDAGQLLGTKFYDTRSYTIWFHSFQYIAYLIFFQNNPFIYVCKFSFQGIFFCLHSFVLKVMTIKPCIKLVYIIIITKFPFSFLQSLFLLHSLITFIPSPNSSFLQYCFNFFSYPRFGV